MLHNIFKFFFNTQFPEVEIHVFKHLGHNFFK